MKLFKRLFTILFAFTFFMVIPNVHAEESGTIGEYETIEEAKEAASKIAIDNDEEKVETTITTKTTEFIEDIKTLDEKYDDEDEAKKAQEIFKEAYIDKGYEEESSTIEKIDEEDNSTEEKDFNKVQDIIEYRKILEDSGYKVNTKLTKISYKTEETDKTDVDQTFNSMLTLSLYSLSLARTYNNFVLQIEDQSYTVVNKDEDVSKTFTNQREALLYLVSLARQYDVSNPSVVFEEVPHQDTEHIKNYFETQSDAETAYNNLLDPSYTLENKEIKKLTESEINSDKNTIINDLSLNNDTSRYSGIHGNSTNVSVTTKDRNGNTITSNGTAVINRVTINGTNHTAVSGISLFNLPNNSVAKVRGTVTYCSNYRTILGVRTCTRYSTSNFESYGLVNTDRNSSSAVLTDNIFYYSLDSFNSSTGEIKDNLVHAYSLDVDKVTDYTVPTYTVSAHIRDEETINQYRLHGTVSKVNIIPTYTVEITKERTIQKFHAITNMIKKNTKDTYIVNYTKTKKEIETEAIKYSSNPQTNDNIIIYFVSLIISVLGTTYILTKKEY